MAIRARGETLSVYDQVNLTVKFKDSTGNLVDTDSYPTISIIQPSGLVAIAPTSAGVSKTATGSYSFIYTIPANGPLGVYQDIWSGYINGFRASAQFSFVVVQTDIPQINVDGYAHIGDNVPLVYSQAAVKNINKLLRSLKARLNSSGKSKSTDKFGNIQFVDCDIFSVDMLVTFLATAVWDFNQVPYFTFFQLDDDNFVEQFGEVLVEGATLYALASKALIERGREFSLQDNSISFTPPTVSEIMMTQYSALLTHFWDKLKMIKASLRPKPLGLGVFGMSSGLNPAIARLRHLRARRII